MAFSGDLQSFCIISAVGHGMKMDRKPQNFISSEKLRISIFTTLSASKERYASSLTHEQRLEHGHASPLPPPPCRNRQKLKKGRQEIEKSFETVRLKKHLEALQPFFGVGGKNME